MAERLCRCVPKFIIRSPTPQAWSPLRSLEDMGYPKRHIELALTALGLKKEQINCREQRQRLSDYLVANSDKLAESVRAEHLYRKAAALSKANHSVVLLSHDLVQGGIPVSDCLDAIAANGGHMESTALALISSSRVSTAKPEAKLRAELKAVSEGEIGSLASPTLIRQRRP